MGHRHADRSDALNSTQHSFTPICDGQSLSLFFSKDHSSSFAICGTQRYNLKCSWIGWRLFSMPVCSEVTAQLEQLLLMR